MLKGCLGLLAVAILGTVAFRLLFGMVGIIAQILGVVPTPIWILIAVGILIWIWRSSSDIPTAG